MPEIFSFYSVSHYSFFFLFFFLSFFFGLVDDFNSYKEKDNWPKFFVPWTSMNLHEKIVDSSLLRISDKFIIVILTSSQLKIFQQSNRSAFEEVQSLTLNHGKSIKSFQVGSKSFIAVARSQHFPVNGGSRDNRDVKTVLYCWSNSIKAFVKCQELLARGATHIEFVQIRQSSFLIVSCSKMQGNNSQTFVFVWSNRRQEFLLYQYLSTKHVVSINAMLTQNTVYLAVHEESEQTLAETKLFFWNGTYFNEFMSSSGRGLIFAMGHRVFKIVDSVIYRLNFESKKFTFHSTLPGPENGTITASSSFVVSNEHFIAGRWCEANEKQSLFIYRMTGFDFDTYQSLPMATRVPFAMKVLWRQRNEVIIAVMEDSVLKLLQWSHM